MSPIKSFGPEWHVRNSEWYCLNCNVRRTTYVRLSLVWRARFPGHRFAHDSFAFFEAWQVYHPMSFLGLGVTPIERHARPSSDEPGRSIP